MSKSKDNAFLLILTVTLTGLSVTSLLQIPLAAYSQTDAEGNVIMESVDQRINQQNIGSGSSTNINCGTNTVATSLAQILPPSPITTCPNIPNETPGTGVTPLVTQREGNVVNLVITGVTSTANCNDDEVVVGGGYRATDNFNIRSEEKVGNSWQINLIGSDGQFQALAECLKLVERPLG